MPHTPIPSIPGTLLTDPTTQSFLSQHVSTLCQLSSNRFPGSQPVSFTAASLDLLERRDFWVCEKSDGVRVLVFIVMNSNTGNQEVWLIDRKQRYFNVEDLHFPHWEDPNSPLTDTILDGELVIDIDPKTGAEILRYYAFDCLVLNGENIMKKNLLSRFGRLMNWVVKPFEKALKEFPEWRETLPFDVVAKPQEAAYHVGQVLNVHIPKLQHGHDGLIFTCADTEYTPGTDEKILKWKPPSENSIDFKLELRFPPSPSNPSEPDFYAKPAFLLNTWLGGDRHEFFDELDVDDEEWESIKQSGDQLDDRVVEVCWSTERGSWRMLRVRDDKPNANHKDVMQKIMISIEDGVEIEAVLSRVDSIRAAWKAREAAKSGRRPQVQTQGLPNTPGARSSVAPGMAAQTPGGGGFAAQIPGGGGGHAVQTPGAAYPAQAQGVVAGLRR